MQKQIQKILDELIAENRERGLQVAAYHNGKLLVHAWAGFTDSTNERAVDAETLFPVFSVSKGITATLIHRLAERGELDYDARVKDYWPEFGVNGKADITVHQVLAHTAGIPQLPADTRPVDLKDWEKMCAVVANLTPVYEPGSREEYHAVTSGWIWGELMRRIDGIDFQTRLQTEIKTPLGIENMFIGIPDEVESRVAILEELGEAWTPTEPMPPYQSIPDSLQPLFELMNLPEARRACVPAATGIMSASSIARHYAALLPGGVDGVELLPPARIARATSQTRFAYKVDGPETTMSSPTAFGHAGHGGAIGFADPERRLAFGFARNRLRGPNHPDTARLLADRIREQLG